MSATQLWCYRSRLERSSYLYLWAWNLQSSGSRFVNPESHTLGYFSPSTLSCKKIMTTCKMGSTGVTGVRGLQLMGSLTLVSTIHFSHDPFAILHYCNTILQKLRKLHKIILQLSSSKDGNIMYFWSAMNWFLRSQEQDKYTLLFSAETEGISGNQNIVVPLFSITQRCHLISLGCNHNQWKLAYFIRWWMRLLPISVC